VAAVGLAGRPASVRVDGRNRSTRLWMRDYTDKKTAFRAVPQIHRRYPDAIIELMPFRFTGFFWNGDSKDAERFYWCLCGGLLRWADDQ
jgi:hypothetical protein